MQQYREGIQESGFNQTPIFSIEENFSDEKFFYWIRDNWTVSIWYSVIYFVLIFGVKYVMKNREPFSLRPLLALWSTALAIFSILGAARTIPEMLYVLSNHGYQYSICNSSHYLGTTSLWVYFFGISKVFELGDTIFIVLRKQKLIFLHWYHHITVLIYAWYIYSRYLGPGRIMIVMNYTVHSFMYSYYALKALKIKVPKFFAVSITTMQIFQMTSGLILQCSAYAVKLNGATCQGSLDSLKVSILLYASYFLLFVYFFYKAYLSKDATKPVRLHVKKD